MQYTVTCLALTSSILHALSSSRWPSSQVTPTKLVHGYTLIALLYPIYMLTPQPSHALTAPPPPGPFGSYAECTLTFTPSALTTVIGIVGYDAQGILLVDDV